MLSYLNLLLVYITFTIKGAQKVKEQPQVYRLGDEVMQTHPSIALRRAGAVHLRVRLLPPAAQGGVAVPGL